MSGASLLAAPLIPARVHDGQQEPQAAKEPPPPQPLQQMLQHREEHYYDPADSGSYPYRPHRHAAVWQDLIASHEPSGQQQDEESMETSATAVDAFKQDPFAWVPKEQSPDAADGQPAKVRPATAQMRSKTAVSMPLEYFDSPDMEQCDLAQQLFEAQAAGAPGLQAVSRFYDPQGAFAWAPCVVLQYDRCVPG